jgi:hypothetical protein
MKAMIRMMVVLAGLLITHGLMAQAPAGSPPGATGMCKDGTYWTGASKQGACRGHAGVKDWYAAPTPASTPAKTPAPAAAASTPAPAAAPAPAPAPKAATKPAPTTTASSGIPAPGGGPGMVWVNTDSKVYHCYGTKYYGTTKAGKYMSEADAKAAGNRPDHGNACSK